VAYFFGGHPVYEKVSAYRGRSAPYVYTTQYAALWTWGGTGKAKM